MFEIRSRPVVDVPQHARLEVAPAGLGGGRRTIARAPFLSEAAILRSGATARFIPHGRLRLRTTPGTYERSRLSLAEAGTAPAEEATAAPARRRNLGCGESTATRDASHSPQGARSAPQQVRSEAPETGLPPVKRRAEPAPIPPQHALVGKRATKPMAEWSPNTPSPRQRSSTLRAP
jgi:hypothetical protein